MNRLRGVVILPPWARYWLMGLGVSWIVFGWSGGGVFWVTVIVFIGIWGILMGRRYVNVTLEPWSKERGIVVWGYRKKHGPIPPPRLVWDDAPPAPEPSAPAPEDAPPTTPAADEAMYRRPPPFPPPPHPESTPAADPTATVPSAAEPAVAADST